MPRTLHVGDDADLIPTLSLALAEAAADPAVSEIVIEPGRYEEHLVIGPRPTPLLIRSSTGDPADVVVTFSLWQGARDRTGMEYVQACATLTIDADDVTVSAVTIENGFDKRHHPDLPNTQALALRTRGDRVRLERCRLLGQQDTVLLDAPSWSAVRHVHLADCYIEGDVDFVYGRATALIEGGEIRVVAPGWIAAPSTARENPRGFLFHRVTVTSDGAPVRLGRPWHPGGKPDAVGQALFVECVFDAEVAPDPWHEMGGFAWQQARFGEYGSTGPGAGAVTAERPVLTERPDVEGWLAGWSGLPAPTGTVRVTGDSTASRYGDALAPRTGWGQVLDEHIDREVDDAAISGASTRSFIGTGALDEVLERTGTGDVVLIAFGHNDPKPDERFSDVFTEQIANLRRFVVGARSRGATPVLVTPIPRRHFVDGRLRSTHGGYPQRIRDLAAEDDVALIDLTVATTRLLQDLGEDAGKEVFLHLAPGLWPGFPDGEADDTHLSRHGAGLVAGLVARRLRELGIVD